MIKRDYLSPTSLDHALYLAAQRRAKPGVARPHLSPLRLGASAAAFGFLLLLVSAADNTVGMTSLGSIYIARKASARRANDPDVRALLREYLESVHAGTETLLLEELGLCQGDVRVDVAAVNGELSGFEIKSPSDTLARFPKQCRIYSKVVDRAWLVAPMKALEKANAPAWWGEIAVFELDDRLALRLVRDAAINPHPDPKSIVRLLWREEALEVLRNVGCARGVMTKSRQVIWQRVIDAVPLDDVRAAVRAALKRRREMIELYRTG